MCCHFQVVPDNENRALYSTHSFKILFKEGGCGTFIPLFFNLISSVRQYNQHAAAQPRVDPLQAAQTPVDEMMRHAYVFLLYHSLFVQFLYHVLLMRRNSSICRYVDPSDPTRIFLQQPHQESELRRRTYQPLSTSDSM